MTQLSHAQQVIIVRLDQEKQFHAQSGHTEEQLEVNPFLIAQLVTLVQLVPLLQTPLQITLVLLDITAKLDLLPMNQQQTLAQPDHTVLLEFPQLLFVLKEHISPTFCNLHA